MSVVCSLTRADGITAVVSGPFNVSSLNGQQLCSTLPLGQFAVGSPVSVVGAAENSKAGALAQGAQFP